jgi:hypothetical protein
MKKLEGTRWFLAVWNPSPSTSLREALRTVREQGRTPHSVSLSTNNGRVILPPEKVATRQVRSKK